MTPDSIKAILHFCVFIDVFFLKKIQLCPLMLIISKKKKDYIFLSVLGIWLYNL